MRFRKAKYFLVLWVFLCTSSFTPSVSKFSVTAHVTNIRSSNGVIQLQVYLNNTNFQEETPFKSVRVSKKKMKNNSLKYTFKDLPAGTYGIALLDDENSNREMDYGWVMPKEGFGFSDYYHTGWSKPSFSDFDFKLSSNKTVKMKVRYL